MTEGLSVGFVGLGDMGVPMATHIIDAGFQTILWARRDATLQPFAQRNFHKASDLAELARLSDIIGVCVFDDDDVREVIMGEGGVLSHMESPGIILIHSTVSVDVCQEIAERAAEKGVSVLDAPVSGTRSRAEQGELSVMVGGDRAAFEIALPVMQAYGKEIECLGPIGSGQKMKMLNNALASINLRMAHLAIETGAQMGLERDSVISMLRTGSASSFIFGFLVDSLMANPEYARHAASMVEKDTALYQKTREEAGVSRSRLDDIAEEAVQLIHDLAKK